MKNLVILLIVFSINYVNSQNIDVNNDFFYQLLRSEVLSGELKSNYSFNLRPVNTKISPDFFKKYYKTVFINDNETIELKTLGIDYFLEFNSHHPYNRNNGTMIPNKGYQHIISPGIFFRIGPLSVQLKPEHHFSENREFDGFWEGHYPFIWKERYKLWNHIDMPERFGIKQHNKITLGQSSIRLNFGKFSLGISNENIWWGPSIRNSIMMSNHAQGFKHLTMNTIEPIKSKFGNIEFQIISGRLENSGYTPPRPDITYAGTRLYKPKINQLSEKNDWRYMQGFILSYSPNFLNNFSFGLIRWVQMYSALVEGRYWWLVGEPTYFPIFKNLFRKNDEFQNYEQQTDQAAGIFLRWFWEDSKSEIYAEFHHNDSKNNIRDLLLDSDHSRAATIGLQKIFVNNNDVKFLFNWEWTQMEQTASRLIRNAGSWYEHSWVYDGYTNRGEVLGSSIGPGSNSHYMSINRIDNNKRIGIGVEILDNDNDFYHRAFASAGDYRRYWKDFNFDFNFYQSFKNFNLQAKFLYSRSLNYQWELDDNATPYYHPGNDVDNLHFNIKFTYFGDW